MKTQVNVRIEKDAAKRLKEEAQKKSKDSGYAIGVSDIVRSLIDKYFRKKDEGGE